MKAWCASAPTQVLPEGVIRTVIRERGDRYGGTEFSEQNRTGHRVQRPRHIVRALHYKVPSWGTHSAIAMLLTERNPWYFLKAKKKEMYK